MEDQRITLFSDRVKFAFQSSKMKTDDCGQDKNRKINKKTKIGTKNKLVIN